MSCLQAVKTPEPAFECPLGEHGWGFRGLQRMALSLTAARGLAAISWLSDSASSFSGAGAESPQIPHSVGCLKRPRLE